MEPIIVWPLIYVLKLENNKYYVGSTYNLNFRYAQHFCGAGAKWTKINKPISIEAVFPNAQKGLENKVTLEYIEKYGKDNVRGGSYCQV
jgi:predicted GIY-YIG superfamily endonuclease